MLFSDLRLPEPILRALAAEGYVSATPIQEQAIPHALAGRDLLGCAQTGTGKTAAFALPILQRLSATPVTTANWRPRCLVLCPTRELATQIGDSFATYGRHLPVRYTVIFGGVGQNPQVSALRRGIDVLIATPGRLLDLLEQGMADLRQIETLVLDEADRMLDMGFIRDIRKIVSRIPAKRQTMLFSATMPPEIRELANSLLNNPAHVQVARESAAADHIEQSVYFVEKQNKPELLAHLTGHLNMYRALIFTRTKHGADRVVRQLHTRGIKAEAIHGNKAQNARQRALQNFKDGKTRLLVATDIASRGIDVDGITHVVNYDLSHEPETYIHRIGRTARAGASGTAISLCDRDERTYLNAIQRLLKRDIPVCNEHPKYGNGQAVATLAPPMRRESRPAHASHAAHAAHAPVGRPKASGHQANRPQAGSHQRPRRDNQPGPAPEGFQPARPTHGGNSGHPARRGRRGGW